MIITKRHILANALRIAEHQYAADARRQSDSDAFRRFAAGSEQRAAQLGRLVAAVEQPGGTGTIQLED